MNSEFARLLLPTKLELHEFGYLLVKRSPILFPRKFLATGCSDDMPVLLQVFLFCYFVAQAANDVAERPPHRIRKTFEIAENFSFIQ